jgi:hypothetical protein
VYATVDTGTRAEPSCLIFDKEILQYRAPVLTRIRVGAGGAVWRSRSRDGLHTGLRRVHVVHRVH